MEEASSGLQDDAVAIYNMKKVYLKDLSFESPKVPDFFSGKAPDDPRHSMHITIGIAHIEMPNNEYEVTLTLAIHAINTKDESLCLLEVQQAGIFLIENVAEKDLEHYLTVHCPRSIFPFARQWIWSMIAGAGFPALLMQDIDFDALRKQND